MQGDLSIQVAQKLRKVLKIIIPVQASPDVQDLIVNVPIQAGGAVDLLIDKGTKIGAKFFV